MHLGEAFLALLENDPGQSSGEPCVPTGGGIVGAETPPPSQVCGGP